MQNHTLSTFDPRYLHVRSRSFSQIWQGTRSLHTTMSQYLLCFYLSESSFLPGEEVKLQTFVMI